MVALQALSLYSQAVSRVPLDLQLSILAGQDKMVDFDLDKSNALLLQQAKVASLPANLNVETSGTGCSLTQTVLR